MNGETVFKTNIFCTNCGNGVESDDKFCSVCGSKNKSCVTDQDEIEIYEDENKPLNIEMNVDNNNNAILDKTTPVKRNKVPIEGWLIMVAFALTYGAIVNIYNFVTTLPFYMDGTYSGLLEKGTEFYSPSLYNFILIDFLSTIVFAIACLLGLYFMHIRSKRFRKHMISFYILILSVSAFLLVMILTIEHPTLSDIVSELRESTYKAFVSSTVTLAIWGTYMVKSERVKLTFGYDDDSKTQIL